MQEEMYIFSEFIFRILTKDGHIWYDPIVKAEVTASHLAALPAWFTHNIAWELYAPGFVLERCFESIGLFLFVLDEFRRCVPLTI